MFSKLIILILLDIYPYLLGALAYVHIIEKRTDDSLGAISFTNNFSIVLNKISIHNKNGWC